MSHQIHGFVFREALAARVTAQHPALRMAALTQGFVLLVVNPDAWDVLEEAYGNGDRRPPRDFERLGPGVRAFGAALSKSGRVAYIETHYFGGTGTQGAAAWSEGREALPPAVKPFGAINEALAFVGVEPAANEDAFNSVGLRRHRHDEGWLEEADRRGR